ncbi:hypothetical protein [Bacillus sp. AFS017336]|uniref:hypothetical protein n=1 Tax=Bacillus sp. AFS017336 TaxID=2033489 RepID=UPI000BF1792F|nr:hypothetical protein [Bacillus sp. AFS017336]PEL13091.1 hypothetical protein CN601_06280 [Bacillus sp. AFS017336]
MEFLFIELAITNFLMNLKSSRSITNLSGPIILSPNETKKEEIPIDPFFENKDYAVKVLRPIIYFEVENTTKKFIPQNMVWISKCK